jgi:RHS repeat-associated protein
MGEPLDQWDESYTSSSSGLTPKTESDTNLQWGPKAYQYDGSGNIKQIGTDEYRYDSAGRLIYAQVSGATITPKTETYKYDSFGNLTERAAGANPVTIPVDGASNRILGVTYDAAGNATSADDGRRKYVWDSADKLSRVHVPIGNQRRMIYDAFDERLATFLVGDSLTRWTIRDFDGDIIREFEAYHYGFGGSSWSWYWDEDYFYGGRTLLAGETQAWQYSSSVQYGGPRHYHLDHLGSVRMVTNNAYPGRALSEHDYFPFGTTATRTYQEQLDYANNHIDAMRFAGHWRDFLGMLNVDNTEYIDYMHARHYDPNVGRFLSVDPVRGDAHHPQSWNRYSYVMNQPVNNIDPNGLCGFTLTGGGSYSDNNTVCAETTAHNPSDLEYRMTMANLAAAENMYYFGMFMDLVAREFSTPFLKFGQALLTDRPGPLISGTLSTAMVAMGPIGGPEEEAAAELGQLGTDVAVTFSKQAIGHGERHLVGSGLTGEAVEAAITKEVQSIGRQAPVSGWFSGRINVNGTIIEYRGFPMPGGGINVGTYYIP